MPYRATVVKNLLKRYNLKMNKMNENLVLGVDIGGSKINMAVWDGKNRAGREAASGVYIALIEAGCGKKTINLAVER